VLALRRVLGAEAVPIGPAAAAPPSWHLAWSSLLLSPPEFTAWLQRHAAVAPAWWSWTGEAPPTFISHRGIFGLILAVRYSMCP
jgi:hypothetical protein